MKKLTPGWLRVHSWGQHDGSGDVQVSHDTVSWSLQETLPQDLPSSAGEGELKQTVCGVGMPVWFSRPGPYGELDKFTLLVPETKGRVPKKTRRKVVPLSILASPLLV